MMYSDDGRYLALATTVRVLVWDLATVRRIVDVSVPSNRSDMVDPEVAFSRDGKHLIALVGTDRRLVDIDVTGMRPNKTQFTDAIGVFREENGDISAVAPARPDDDSPATAAQISLSDKILAGSWPIAITLEGNRVVLRHTNRTDAHGLGTTDYSVLAAQYEASKGRMTVFDRVGTRSIDITTGQVARTRRFEEIRSPLARFATLQPGDNQTLLVFENGKVSVIDTEAWKQTASYVIELPSIFIGTTVYHRVGRDRLRAIKYIFAYGEFEVADIELNTGRQLSHWHKIFYKEFCGSPMCPSDWRNDRYIAISNPARVVTIVDARTGDVVRTIKPEVSFQDVHPMRRTVTDPAEFQKNGFTLNPIFEKDGRRITIQASDPRTRGIACYFTYDIESGELVAKRVYSDYIAEETPNAGSYLIVGGGGSIARFNTDERATVQIYDPHPNIATWAFEDVTRDRTISIDGSGNVHISQGSTSKRLATLALADRDEWIVATPTGFFDGTPKSIGRVGVRLQSLEILPIQRVAKAFARPELVAATLAGDPQAIAVAEAKKLGLGALGADGVAPDVKVIAKPSAAGDRTDIAALISSGRFGAGRVEWRRNGVLQAVDDLIGRDGTQIGLSCTFGLDFGPEPVRNQRL